MRPSSPPLPSGGEGWGKEDLGRPKPEARSPKEGRIPKSEARNQSAVRASFGLRPSAFGFPLAFGLRFSICSVHDLRINSYMRWRVIALVSLGVNIILAAAWWAAVRQESIRLAAGAAALAQAAAVPARTNLVVRRQSFSWHEIEAAAISITTCVTASLKYRYAMPRTKTPHFPWN